MALTKHIVIAEPYCIWKNILYYFVFDHPCLYTRCEILSLIGVGDGGGLIGLNVAKGPNSAGVPIIVECKREEEEEGDIAGVT